MKRQILPLLWAFLSIFTLFACTPVYKTTYSYEPPVDSGAESCLQICKSTKAQCQHNNYDNADDCVQEAKRQYAKYQAELNEDENQRKDLNSFYKALKCRPLKNSHCLADFRACYKMCGGKVISHQQCISNC